MADVARVVTEANPTILWGVGSYLRRFLAHCTKEDRRLPSVRMVVASGEALEPAVTSSILRSLQSLGAANVVISPGFGASELQCSLVACNEGSGLHNPAPELFLLQTVDEDAKTLPSGATGRLVLTHLDRTGTVLIRYALGDVVTLDRHRCPACGRAGERIVEHHGRGDTMVKVRGQLIDLRVVAGLVAADPDVTEHAIDLVPSDHQDASAMDVLRVRIAIAAGADPVDIAGRVEQSVSSAVSVRPLVIPTGAEEIFPVDEVMKPARVRRAP
jgi:phenylacetate-coenzyme A ligase PaaK-like adenylate-forming protein